MAHVRERSGSYRVEWRRGGRQGTSQSVTMPDLKLAEAAKALAESRHHDISDTDVYAAVLGLDDTAATGPTMAAYSEEWLTSKEKSGHVSADTLDGYRQTVTRWILPHLGKLHLTEITKETEKRWIAWLQTQLSRNGKPLAPATIRRIHAIAHQILASAVPRHIPANPFATEGRGKNKALPAVDAHDAQFLEPWEVDLILGHCPPEIADLVYLAPRTGLRLGELLALRVGIDVRLDAKTPHLLVQRALKNNGRFGPPKSKRSKRAVSIQPAVVARLRARVTGRTRGELLFATEAGTPWNKHNLRRRHFAEAVAAAQRCPTHMPPAPAKAKTGPARKYRVTEVSTCECPTRLNRTPRFHDLRHTHVAWLLAAGGWDLFAISRRLGHESVKTTFDIYGHLLPQGEQARLKALEDLLGDAVADDTNEDD